MTEREEELNFIFQLIDKFCAEYKVSLVPKETTKGTKYVGILDTITGKEYAIVKKD